MTTQKQIREAFWQANPDLPRRKYSRGALKGMYCADTRCAFVEFVDMLAREGQISEALAFRATL